MVTWPMHRPCFVHWPDVSAVHLEIAFEFILSSLGSENRIQTLLQCAHRCLIMEGKQWKVSIKCFYFNPDIIFFKAIMSSFYGDWANASAKFHSLLWLLGSVAARFNAPFMTAWKCIRLACPRMVLFTTHDCRKCIGLDCSRVVLLCCLWLVLLRHRFVCRFSSKCRCGVQNSKLVVVAVTLLSVVCISVAAKRPQLFICTLVCMIFVSIQFLFTCFDSCQWLSGLLWIGSINVAFIVFQFCFEKMLYTTQLA